MTSYVAYDEGLPCKNPNCKSEGKPHPNCKCYGNMADGGQVKSFCSTNQVHKKNCMYFAEGGEVSPINSEEATVGYITKNGLHGLMDLDKEENPKKYRDDIQSGNKKLSKYISSLFDKKEPPPKQDLTKQKEKISKWMSKGGVDHDVQHDIYKQNQGALTPSMIENLFPDHNIALQASKGTASNYLNRLRPQENSPKLAFDSEPNQRNINKVYERAQSIAADPMTIINHIKNGSIDKEHVEHLQGMYPQLNQAIQKEVTKHIIEAQLKNQKPSQRIRQGLSLLMGTPLSSEFTPQNITAAQAVFQSQKQTPMMPQKPKSKSKVSLSKSDQAFLTSSQSLVSRQQREK